MSPSRKLSAEVVIVGGGIVGCAAAYYLARRGRRVVLGGVHPSILPDEAARHADAVVVGEAEGVWKDVLADASSGSLRPRYHCPDCDLGQYVPMRKESFARKSLFRVLPALTTRGCPFNCDFCCVSDLYGKKIRHLPVANVVRFIRETGGKTYLFLDDNIVGDRRYARELFEGIKPLGIKWVGQASVSFSRDQELMKLAAGSGCAGLFFGVESVSAAQLLKMRKSPKDLVSLEDAIQRVRDHGMFFHTSLVFGFDEDTKAVFPETLAFLVRNKIGTATFNVLTPPEAYNIPIQVRDPGPDGRAGTADDGQMLDLLNLTPSLIGKTLNTYMNMPDYTEEARNIEVVATRRFSGRWSMTASYAVTWRNDYNSIPYNPNAAPQSDYVSMTFVKLSGSYEPGWGVRLSPLVRYQAGTPYGRRASVSLNYGSQTVLIEPVGTQRMDAPFIFDLRGERKFVLPKGTTAAVVVDLFNIANSNAEVDINTQSGSTYQWPISVLPPRVLRFGLKFSW